MALTYRFYRSVTATGPNPAGNGTLTYNRLKEYGIVEDGTGAGF